MLLKLAIYLPLAVALLLLTLKFYFESYVRFEQVGPAISRLDESGLQTAYKKKPSLLCVGCTAGIGEALAQAACNNGGSVVVVGRREKKFEPCNGTIKSISADLSSVAIARQTARQIASTFQIDTIVFTVGITAGSVRKVNSEGIELDAAVSFFARYVMSEALIPTLVSNPTRKARVFIMGFPGANGEGSFHDFNWETSEWGSGWAAHFNTVIANDALVSHLSAKYQNINFYGLNPGIMVTDILRGFLGDGLALKFQQNFIGLVTPKVSDYVDGSSVHSGLKSLIVSSELESKGGSYFNQKGEPIKRCPFNLIEGNAEAIIKAADAVLLSRKL